MRTNHAALAIALACLTATGASRAADPSLDDLAWIAGAWQSAPGKTQSEEHWTRPAGGMMLGMSRTLVDGRAVFFEFLRIESRPDGIYYVAQPKGRPGTDFKLKSASAQEVVFENLKHDFPKRILYRKSADGGLTARVEGDGTEKEKPEDYVYRPMK